MVPSCLTMAHLEVCGAVDCIGTLLNDVDPWLPEHISYLDMTEPLKDLFCSWFEVQSPVARA